MDLYGGVEVVKDGVRIDYRIDVKKDIKQDD